MSVDIDVTFGPAIVVSVATTTTSERLVSSPCSLVGWSLRETTGAASAEVEFTSGNNPIGESSIGPNGSDTHNMSGNGVYVQSDITLNVVSGSVRGAIYVRLYR